MELDKRIIDGKKPLDCFDTDVAKQFIGQRGYFSHYIDNYADLKNTVLGTLGGTGDTFHESFCCTEQPFDNYYYEFFIPAEYVKPEEPEKKYRAFTIKEFQQKYSVGSVLKIRQKQNRFTESVVQYVGYKKYEERIYLGITDFTLDELFENFEMIEPQSDTWHPFGVIDEDKE